jgi:hypothetical protein
LTFDNCSEAYAAGVSDIKRDHAQYAKKLDRDGDGIACETESAPAGFVPKKETETGTGTRVVEQGAGNGDLLPKTGPGEITAVGAILVTLGAVIALAVRRRRTRFAA